MIQICCTFANILNFFHLQLDWENLIAKCAVEQWTCNLWWIEQSCYLTSNKALLMHISNAVSCLQNFSLVLGFLQSNFETRQEIESSQNQRNSRFKSNSFKHATVKQFSFSDRLSMAPKNKPKSEPKYSTKQHSWFVTPSHKNSTNARCLSFVDSSGNRLSRFLWQSTEFNENKKFRFCLKSI